MSRKYNDVIIYIGGKANFKKFNADSDTLCKKSDYFKNILNILSAEGTIKKKYVIEIPNITPQIFEFIINYLTTGYYAEIKDKTGFEVLDIIIASYYLKFSELIEFAEDFFLDNIHRYNDPIRILQKVYCHKDLNHLRKPYLETICFTIPKILFNTDKFISLPPRLLKDILKQDDINLFEIEIWESLIKWGLAREKTLDKDVSKWNQEKFIILEKILHDFIPLIRFYDVSSEDYFCKVRPYEEILPKELHEEILKFYMVPGYKPTFNNHPFPRCPNSVIIKSKHLAIFAGWIDKKEGSTKYKFNLLYRTGRDGFTVAEFHNKCDNKGATLIVAKIKNLEKILGGYNPLDWNGNGYKYSKDGFIFSFTNRNNLQTGKVGYIKDAHYDTIYCDKNSGPIFGNIDLLFQHNNNLVIRHNIYTYPEIDISYDAYCVDNYEVFQVIEK